MGPVPPLQALPPDTSEGPLDPKVASDLPRQSSQAPG